MKNYIALFLGVFIIFLSSCSSNIREGEPRILVFSKTMGYKHSSIPQGMEAIQKLGIENNFLVDTTKNAEVFNDEDLKKYSAIVFLSTTGNILDAKQEAAFERYIQAGGGFVGVHAATDTEYDWGWYGKLVGAYFDSHPAGTPEADFIIKDNSFAATNMFEDTIWHRSDELYNFKKLNPEVNVLMTVDEETYEGGKNGEHHPMSWFHEYDGGRAFYTALGHTAESFSEDLFLRHFLGGINYAIGKNEILDYSKVTSQIPPDSDRFTKVTLKYGEFFEPTEMAILPNNDILISQRRGEIMLYKDATKELSQVGFLDVYHKTLSANANAEEGLMGLQKDPNFESNHWIYLYYSPTGDKWVNRLSRFKFENDVLDTTTEQIILEVDSQREICCHTGGSIAFGPDNMLYLSTGDNSTPFSEKGVKYVNSGFAPLNDLPGKEQYDARRSSGNTNDLRGKILRIKINEDGSYSIPEGNLFPVGTAKTRPEIYTMGHRNPYRISVDPKKGYVYWGDVGPDARMDSLDTRGPRGYDEMNQAREAGNFGWPLFVADNKPYRDYDYATGESGEAFDPAKPINDSKNNTGLRELPKAMPAYGFYPYVASQEFPQTGTGGRNAMAGPVYYSDLYNGPNALPEYYDGKVLVYDWIRGWMMAVSLFPNGEFNKMEPFADQIKVNNLIDMEVGPDGRVYLLEYGSGWFSKNDDSALSYIEYNGGNRPPVVENITVDKTSGKLPLTITAKVMASDREEDVMTYIWDLGNGETKETATPELTYTYENVGDYFISTTVTDSKDASVKSEPINIVVGNSRPEVSIDIIGGNTTSFNPGMAIDYKVSVTDPDGSDIDENNIFVSVDYLEGMDEASLSLGHQEVSAAVTGKALTLALDCKTCHKEREKSVGPMYIDIAEKYKNDKKGLSYLQGKIISGGSGVWGEVTMPAHPNLTQDESRQIGLYIQSLASTGVKKKSLPAVGTIKPNPVKGTTVMVITASYTDQGGNNVKPLTGSKSVVLQMDTNVDNVGAK
ncbi:ThuA domain-containing protein [Arenibacter troitsensis]|uniref:Glucose/arabinose dehydrogenase, beta-propeller fold n=1 Tax=Arenibacter troitsensis TaxID=188872 RepID=A0A1X7I4Z2_9FLAO|nr:ThuA domain-containing protein [Arenibacter troitsensis]SMG09077.1 Glucose/arabinose dehydrogenase, beta-propeller fold [Arenibacter troitsensis]